VSERIMSGKWWPKLRVGRRPWVQYAEERIRCVLVAL